MDAVCPSLAVDEDFERSRNLILAASRVLYVIIQQCWPRILVYERLILPSIVKSWYNLRKLNVQGCILILLYSLTIMMIDAKLDDALKELITILIEIPENHVLVEIFTDVF